MQEIVDTIINPWDIDPTKKTVNVMDIFNKYEVTKASGKKIDNCIVLELDDQVSIDTALNYSESLLQAGRTEEHNKVINTVRAHQLKNNEE